MVFIDKVKETIDLLRVSMHTCTMLIFTRVSKDLEDTLFLEFL